MIVLVDYGLGNLGSITNMLKKIGTEPVVSSDTADVARADKLILSGVGHFDAGIERLEDRGLRPALENRVLGDGVPILGICLGFQLFARSSEEGQRRGLGWLDAEVVRFRPRESRLRVPHMGWNEAQLARRSPLFDGIPTPPRFYYLHSYHVVCHNPSDVIALTSYGVEFVAAAEHGRIAGVQFHPEKSHSFGLKLLRNFCDA